MSHPHHTHNAPRKRTTRVKSIDPRKHEYIAPAYLDNLAEYMYSGSDFSVVGKHIMQPYWRWVSEQIPLSVAPNMLTFLGFLISTSGTLLLLYFYAFEEARFPPWAWVYVAFSVFAYQTLDAIDGKQARRTGTGGPMGELFDHGCDAFFTPLLQISLCLGVDLSPTLSFWFMCIICNGLFFTIWEQFSTGTLDLGYINGPTDGLLITCGLFLSSAYLGNKWWSDPFQSPIEVPLIDLKLRRPNEILFVVMTFLALATLLANVAHVLGRKSVQVPKVVALAYAAPIVTLLFGYWTLINEFPALHQKYLFVAETAFGLCASFCATRLTISRLCKMPYEVFNKFSIVSNAVVWSGVLLSRYSPDGPRRDLVEDAVECAIVLLCAGGIATYYHLIAATFRQLMEHLDLSLLTFTEKQHRAIAQRAAAKHH